MTNTFIPSHIRPLVFAEGELLLDLLYLAERHYRVDLESLLIMICVNDATMRPFMTDSDLDHGILTLPEIPSKLRGAISRLKVADKTGLSRETVRRRCKMLLDRGLLVEPEEGHLRTQTFVGDTSAQKSLEEGHRAAQRYARRLRSFGIET